MQHFSASITAKFRQHRRQGVLASIEIAVIVAALFVLLWVGTALLPADNKNTPSDAALSSSSSTRGIYRLSLSETGDSLKVLRANHEASEIKLLNGQPAIELDTYPSLLSNTIHSRDGTTTLSVTWDQQLLLERNNGDPEWLQLPLKGSALKDAAVSRNGDTAIVALRDGTILGWILNGNSMKYIEYHIPHADALCRMSMSNDGRLLYAAFDDGTASIHETKTGAETLKIAGRVGECTAAEWSEDGRFVATATSRGFIELIETSTGRSVWQADGETHRVLCRVTEIAFSPDGKWIAASGLHSTFVLWSITEPQTVRRISGHTGLVRAIEFSRTSDSLFTGSLDGTIRQWSLESFSLLNTIE